MTRSVLFDTETTGLDPLTGDRVIEFAALELVRDLPTGKRLHLLIHPDRDIPEDSIRVHGITLAKLTGERRFHEVADEILDFLGDDRLVAHNAPFDFGFLDAELARLRRPPLGRERMVDTLALAKARYPGMPNSLDALCRRFGIDLSDRTTHNALLDCRLLADVYIELTGGRQRGLLLGAAAEGRPGAIEYAGPRYAPVSRSPRPMVPDAAALAAHAAFVVRIKDAIWLA